MNSYRVDYFGTEVLVGPDALPALSRLLDARGLRRALVVCGRSTAANARVLDPLRDMLGARLAGTFDGVTPAKTLSSVYEGIAVMQAHDADVLVGVGGGSAMDTARQMSVFAANGQPAGFYLDAAQRGRLEAPGAPGRMPVALVPTTLAGADLSSGGTIEVLAGASSPTGLPLRTHGTARPITVILDPGLFAATPVAVLRGSAMNGFHKGIETLYSRGATPVTDATAVRGLQLLSAALPRLGDDDPRTLQPVLDGHLLVQFLRRTSIIHAFGHAVSRQFEVQQGLVHAVVGPPVLRFVLDQVDGRRDLLALGLGTGTRTGQLVDRLAALRDGLGLPDTLRRILPVDALDPDRTARLVCADPGLARAPVGLDLTTHAAGRILSGVTG